MDPDIVEERREELQLWMLVCCEQIHQLFSSANPERLFMIEMLALESTALQAADCAVPMAAAMSLSDNHRDARERCTPVEGLS